MKRLLSIVCLALLFALSASAQEGLQINGIFNAGYRTRKDATEVLLRGDRLREYGLKYFRSLTFNPTYTELAAVERRVKADAAGAVDSESATMGKHLYYGIFQLKPRGRVQRYIFYRNNGLGKSGKRGVTLIYMEGKTTLAELKRNFAR